MTPSDWLGDIVSRTPVSGGCISRAERVVVRHRGDANQSLLVKTNSADFADNFIAESRGLDLLADAADQVDGLVVPRALATGLCNGEAVLILPWINATENVDEVRLAEVLARMHVATSGREIGLNHDNYLGSAAQPNEPLEDWPTFFADRRLGHQMRWAQRQGILTPSLQRSLARILDRIEYHWPDDSTSLLHGDLWSGNVMQTFDGEIVLIDPAVCHGPVEMELGMVRLFGGASEKFWQHYQLQFPLAAGWSHRVDLAMLYHLLNHFNLFGQGYLRHCEMLAMRLSETTRIQ